MHRTSTLHVRAAGVATCTPAFSVPRRAPQWMGSLVEVATRGFLGNVMASTPSL